MNVAAREYFESVERHFVERRGRPLLLSPEDVRRVGRWQREGVPLEAVLEGVDLHFERLARRGRPARRAITLAYVEDDVLDAWAGVAQRQLGRRPNAGESASSEPLAGSATHARLQAALEQAASDLAAAAGDTEQALAPHVQRAAKRLADKAELFDADRAAHDPARCEQHLQRLEKALDRAARTALGDAGLAALREAAEQDLEDKRARMGVDTYEKVIERVVARRTRERFGLPRLSIYAT